MLRFVSEYEPLQKGFDTTVKIDLITTLIPHPNSTFFMRMASNELARAGVFSQDIFVVDRSLSPSHKSLIVGYLNGVPLARYYLLIRSSLYLSPLPIAHPTARRITDNDVFQLFGVVTAIIRQTDTDRLSRTIQSAESQHTQVVTSLDST